MLAPARSRIAVLSHGIWRRTRSRNFQRSLCWANRGAWKGILKHTAPVRRDLIATYCFHPKRNVEGISRFDRGFTILGAQRALEPTLPRPMGIRFGSVEFPHETRARHWSIYQIPKGFPAPEREDEYGCQ
jgi:hypothetical protein